MQSDISNLDITSINIQLNELRSKFDQAMREEHDFHQLQEMYHEIKKLECYVRALQWDPENRVMQQSPFTPGWV